MERKELNWRIDVAQGSSEAPEKALEIQDLIVADTTDKSSTKQDENMVCADEWTYEDAERLAFETWGDLDNVEDDKDDDDKRWDPTDDDGSGWDPVD